MDKVKDEFDELDEFYCKFGELDEMKHEFNILNCKFGEMDQLKDKLE